MRIPRLRLAALGLVSAVALSGCAYGLYDDPYGYGSYGGLSVGYGSGYYGYGYPYGGYGSGYGYGAYDPFGWYGDYYYPGSGIYVYDRYRTRRVWSDAQRRYWNERGQHWRNRSAGMSGGTSANWSGFNRSHWRDGSSATTTNGNGTGTWTRGNWRERSQVTTSGQQTQSSDGARFGGRGDRRRGGRRPD